MKSHTHRGMDRWRRVSVCWSISSEGKGSRSCPGTEHSFIHHITEIGKKWRARTNCFFFTYIGIESQDVTLEQIWILDSNSGSLCLKRKKNVLSLNRQLEERKSFFLKKKKSFEGAFRVWVLLLFPFVRLKMESALYHSFNRAKLSTLKISFQFSLCRFLQHTPMGSK